MKQENQWLVIKNSQWLLRINTNDIVYIKADGNYCYIHLVDGIVYNIKSQLHEIDDCFKQLKRNHFIRVGKSHTINKDYIYIIIPSAKKLYLKATKIEIVEVEDKIADSIKHALKAKAIVLGQKEDDHLSVKALRDLMEALEKEK